MKRTLLFFVSILAVALIQAQSFTLTDEEGNDVTSLTVDYPAEAGVPAIEPHFYATNNSADAKTVRTKKIYVSVVEGTVNSFCFAGNCYGPEAFVSQSYYELQAGETIPHGQELHPIYEHYNIDGVTTITYTYFDVFNEDDSAYVTVNFIYPADVVNDLETSNATVSNAYPNPANNFARIDIDIKSVNNTELVFYNVLGEEIHKQEISKGKETIEINTSNWASGIYYYSLINNSHNLSTKKLIINH